MNEPATIKAPEIPGELWMFWVVDNGEPFQGERQGGFWLGAADDPRDAENYLVALARKDAEQIVRHQAETYDIECIPVRVK